IDPRERNTGIQSNIYAIKQEDDIWQHFVEPEEAEDIVTSRSLIVVVDTHKPAMVSNERLLQKSEYRVVIDHHRRGEDFIQNPTLVYMEPYASSSAGIQVILLQALPLKMHMVPYRLM